MTTPEPRYQARYTADGREHAKPFLAAFVAASWLHHAEQRGEANPIGVLALDTGEWVIAGRHVHRYSGITAPTSN